MIEAEQRHALEELVSSEGWKTLQAYVVKEWGSDAILDRLTSTLGRVQSTTEADEQRELAKLLNARAVARMIMEFPVRELKSIRSRERAELRPTTQRRAG